VHMPEDIAAAHFTMTETSGKKDDMNQSMPKSPMLHPTRHRVVLRPALRQTSPSDQKAREVVGGVDPHEENLICGQFLL
jgi:hypothetical protein